MRRAVRKLLTEIEIYSNHGRPSSEITSSSRALHLLSTDQGASTSRVPVTTVVSEKTSTACLLPPLPYRSFSASGAHSGSDEELKEVTDLGPAHLSASQDSLSFTGASEGFLNAENVSYAASTAEQLSLATAWDDAWVINKAFQYGIEFTHSYTGLPWWQSIAIATVVSRVVTAPINIMQIKNAHRMSLARPELQRLAEWFKEQQSAGRGEEAKKEYMSRMAALWKKYDCSPLKSLAPLLAQAPIFIGFFKALQSLSAAKVPSMTVGGPQFAWFADLTVPDPYYVLPIVSSLTLLLTVELNAADGLQGQSPKTISTTKNVMRGVAVLALFVTGSMPQGIFYYWITSSILALGQSFVLKVEAIRKVLKLPALKTLDQGSTAEVAAMAAAAAGKPVKTFSVPPRKPKQSQQ